MKNLKIVLPYLLVTLLCIGGVEFFYMLLEKNFLRLPSGTKKIIEVPSEETSERVIVENVYDYQVIIDRNLFGATLTAKPESEGGGAVDELDTTLLDIVLLGTITGAASESRGFILDKSTNIQAIYHKGDTIQGATIKDILRGKIVLNYRGKNEVLHMTTKRDTASQAVAVTPSSRMKRTLVTPKRRALSPGVPKEKIRTVPPSRRFSFKKAKKSETSQ